MPPLAGSSLYRAAASDSVVGGIAVYNSNGMPYYGHSDHLGSMKLGSAPSRTIYFANNHYAGHGPTTVRLFQELLKKNET